MLPMDPSQTDTLRPDLPPNWLDQVTIRQLGKADLRALEWEGEFIHFRRLYASAYERARMGLALLWGAFLPGDRLIGQLFIQLLSDRLELADGSRRAYLYSFRIRPAYRGNGLGTRMLEVIEQDLIARGYEILTLNVAKDNTRAQALYRRLGFRITAHEPGIWSYPDHEGVWRRVVEPAWRMEKRLKQPHQ